MHKKRISPLLIVVLSFLGVIVIGTVLLALPIAVKTGRLAFIDAIFLSFSSVCVTGLTPIADLGATLSLFGKIVIAILIQVGGLGIVTIAIYVLVLLGIRIGVTERLVIKEALNQNSIQGMVRLVQWIILTSLAFELFGTILNMFVFSADYPFWEALGISVFHAVSSFNNAGFDIIGPNSFIAYADNFLFNLSTAILVIGGGIGFIVINDVVVKKRWKSLTNYTKIVLKVTAFLLVIGTVVIKAAEGAGITWMQAFFQSFTARTAGFYTADLTRFAIPTIAFLIALMFIGASPNSTGGGIKTTTAYTIIRSTIFFLQGRLPIIKKRKIDDETRLKAFSLAFVSLCTLFLGFILVATFETGTQRYVATTANLFFESVSAFGTVGLSLGITPFLAPASKIILVILMFVGRLGPIAIFGIWNKNWGHPFASNIDYAPVKIIIG
ncbi:MAG: potassium transporter TrkG [bacterium]